MSLAVDVAGKYRQYGPTQRVKSLSIIFMVSHSSAGGAQEIWANLAGEFRARGHDVRLMALYPYREQVRETVSGLPWSYVVPRRPTSVGAQVGMMRAMVRLFKVEPPDVVFTALPAANVLVPIAARVAGAATRVVISHHSPAQTYNRILDSVDGLVGSLGNVRTVISVSDAVGASLAGKPRAYRAKRQTIHNALPPHIEQHIDRLAAERRRRGAVGRRVVATGRLAPQKNYPALVQAAVHMPDVEVAIIGSGPDEAMLKALARDLGVSERVDFLGHRPRDEALALLAAGDVFTQPSLFEGHSLGLIEAAKLGLPLVVSDVPTQLEGIRGPDGTPCGLSVPPRDAEGLARALLQLLDDPDEYDRWRLRASVLAEANTFGGMMEAYQRLTA